MVQPTAPIASSVEPIAAKPHGRKPARTVAEEGRTSRLGSPVRFDLSKEALSGRRSKADRPQ